jgi:hypothetical protein
MNRFGSPRPVEFADELVELVELVDDVPVDEDAASAAIDNKLLICMATLP